MQSIFAAFRFLTCIPFPGSNQIDSKQLGSSSAWFPLVGVFLGVILALVGSWLEQFFTFSAVAASLLAIWVALSGGLHMDGLMDTADGLCGAREAKRALEIMRDSRVGAMGVAAAIIVTLLKWVFLTSLLEIKVHATGVDKWIELIVVPAIGRWGMVYLLFFYPYARREGGLAQPFSTGTKGWQFFIASFTIAAACLLGGKGVLWFAWAGVLLVTAIAGWRISKRLGGITGDVCGAVNELGEVVALVILVALHAR